MRVLQRLFSCCGSSGDVISSSKSKEIDPTDLSDGNIEKLKTQLEASKYFSFSEGCVLEGSPRTSFSETPIDFAVSHVYVDLSKKGSFSSLSDSCDSKGSSCDSIEKVIIQVLRQPRFVGS